MVDSSNSRHGLEARVERLRASRTKAAALDVAVLASVGHVNLRGRPDDEGFRRGVESVLQQPLPLEPNTVSGRTHRLFWLGPDEWLLVVARGEVSELVCRLEDALRDRHAAVNDLSGGQVMLRLAGPSASEVLAAGCALDLQPASFPPGRCAQTGLAKAAVLLCPLPAGAGFELVVRRTLADYLLGWLERVVGSRGLRLDVL
jgi:sarcosine oxidase subunit gamma